mgnify:CR=1 FL=1
MKLIDPFMLPKGRGTGKRGRQFSIQKGSSGTAAVDAVRAMIELGQRQKIGKRLGAEAVIKAERR